MTSASTAMRGTIPTAMKYFRSPYTGRDDFAYLVIPSGVVDRTYYGVNDSYGIFLSI